VICKANNQSAKSYCSLHCFDRRYKQSLSNDRSYTNIKKVLERSTIDNVTRWRKMEHVCVKRRIKISSMFLGSSCSPPKKLRESASEFSVAVTPVPMAGNSHLNQAPITEFRHVIEYAILARNRLDWSIGIHNIQSITRGIANGTPTSQRLIRSQQSSPFQHDVTANIMSTIRTNATNRGSISQTEHDSNLQKLDFQFDG
jgi:hypothetical protein